MNNQIFLCKNCGVRFPVTNNALEGKEHCVMCGGDVDIVVDYVNYEVSDNTDMDVDNGIILEVVLDNVRSAWNVGSMFRTADACGVNKVHVCGISPTPENDKVKKTALGAEKVVQWEYHNNSVELVKQLKQDGYEVWAMEYSENSSNLFEVIVNSNDYSSDSMIVVVFGHEVGGVDPGVLQEVDKIVHLPMIGVKNSINVSVAFGVGVYLTRDMLNRV